jgi:streptogramin lyase
VPAELRQGQPEGVAHDRLDETLLPQIRALLASNQKIEAIKLVRQHTSIGLKEAKDAVDEIEAGRRTSLAGLSTAEPSFTETIDLPVQPSSSRRSGCVWIAVIVCFIFLLAGVAAVAVFLRAAPPAPTAILPTKMPTPSMVPTLFPTPPFASLAATIGSEGIGAGKFTEANSLAIDPDGNLYIGDIKGNRVQVFDPSGKFIVQWNLDPSLHIYYLAAGMNGELYINMGGRIFHYDRKTGQQTGEVQYTDATDGDIDDFGSMAVGLDGSLLATWINNTQESDTLLRFDPSGKLIQTIANPIQEQTGEFESKIFLALDGLGNIYALSAFNPTVCEYSPQGKLITRFGSKGSKPGQFEFGQDIAVDSRGRIFVNEFNKVHIYDASGLYLDSFDIKDGAYVMAFDRQDNLFLLNNTRMAKYIFRDK